MVPGLRLPTSAGDPLRRLQRRPLRRVTDELATELARVGQLQRLVARASDRLFDQALRIVRAEGGE
jgi:hypothetical protein